MGPCNPKEEGFWHDFLGGHQDGPGESGDSNPTQALSAISLRTRDSFSRLARSYVAYHSRVGSILGGASAVREDIRVLKQYSHTAENQRVWPYLIAFGCLQFAELLAAPADYFTLLENRCLTDEPAPLPPWMGSLPRLTGEPEIRLGLLLNSFITPKLDEESEPGVISWGPGASAKSPCYIFKKGNIPGLLELFNEVFSVIQAKKELYTWCNEAVVLRKAALRHAIALGELAKFGKGAIPSRVLFIICNSGSRKTIGKWTASNAVEVAYQWAQDVSGLIIRISDTAGRATTPSELRDGRNVKNGVERKLWKQVKRRTARDLIGQLRAEVELEYAKAREISQPAPASDSIPPATPNTSPDDERTGSKADQELRRLHTPNEAIPPPFQEKLCLEGTKKVLGAALHANKNAHPDRYQFQMALDSGKFWMVKVFGRLYRVYCSNEAVYERAKPRLAELQGKNEITKEEQAQGR
jgi:hypothetical protein